MLQPGSNMSISTSYFSFSIFTGKPSMLILHRDGCYLLKLPTQWNPMERQGKNWTRSMANQERQPRGSSDFSSELLVQNCCASPIQQTLDNSARLFGHIYMFQINGISQALARFWHLKRLSWKKKNGYLNSYDHTKPLLQSNGVEGNRTAHINFYVNSTWSI